MYDFFNSVVLGIVEGLTEFIPVSSSGHLIIARDYLGLVGPSALSFDAVLQLATACALLVFFFKDVLNLAYTALYLCLGLVVRTEDKNMLVAVIIGTVPAILAGLLLEKYMDSVFRSAHLVAYALIVGSAVMVAAEWQTKRVATRKTLGLVSWMDGLTIGLFQCLALVPGMSRSGMTMAGGMFAGFTRADAARFGFVLSLPILFGSGLKKLYELHSTGALTSFGPDLLVGSIAAFISGLAAVWVLMSVVRRTPLTVFAVYRVLLAVLILVVLN